MKLGIMQPYFMPYIGYWQLLNAVDKYVVYDDVNFIKGGWINRNRILVEGQAKYFNIPMLGASSFKLINEIGVNHDTHLKNKNLRVLEAAYKKAPFFDAVYPIMESILSYQGDNLADFVTNSIKDVCKYLDITTTILLSSGLKKDNQLKAQAKVLSICNLLGADEYYNAIGGRSLYSFSEFAENGIKLRFLNPMLAPYKQFNNEFQPGLSIIDVMMFNSVQEIQNYLSDFQLISDENEPPLEENVL